MARQSRSQSAGTRRRRTSSRDGHSASEKPDEYRFARNVEGEETAAESEYRAYAAEARDEAGGEPDVLLDIPVVKVDSIHLEVEDLDAQVSLQAKVLELLDIDVGVEVHLGKVKIDIKGVEAQALLKVRLDHVTAIIDRVMTTLDRNPELVESIGRAVEQIGEGAEGTLGGAGQAAGELGEGAEGALDDVGEGAGQAVGDIGEGASEAVGELGEGAGQAVGQVGEGAGQVAGNLDQAVGNVGETAGQAVGGAGQAAGGAGEAVGGAGQAVGQAAGGLGQAVGGAGEAAGGGELTGPKIAKAAAKTVAKEIGSAASDEAKGLGIAAAEKVKELGDRRRHRRLVEQIDATDAALRTADELGVDITEVEGTGANGRITIGDVRDSAEE